MTYEILNRISESYKCKQRFNICPPRRLLLPLDPISLSFNKSGWTTCGIDKDATSESTILLTSASHSNVDEIPPSPVSQSIPWRLVLVCIFCNKSNEDSVVGRLLPIPQRSCYGHLNCIRASRGVEQTQHSELLGVESAVDRFENIY